MNCRGDNTPRFIEELHAHVTLLPKLLSGELSVNDLNASAP
jgi:hypothetical protein